MLSCTAGPCCELVKAAEDLLEQAIIDDHEARLAAEELRQFAASIAPNNETSLIRAIQETLHCAIIIIKLMKDDITGFLQLVSNLIGLVEQERAHERLSQQQAERLRLLGDRLKNTLAQAVLSRKRCLPPLDALWECSDRYLPRALNLSLQLTAKHYHELVISGPAEFRGYHDGKIDVTWKAAMTLQKEGPSSIEMPGGDVFMDETTGQPANAPREPAGPPNPYAHFCEYLNNRNLEYWFTGKADVIFKVDNYTGKARKPEEVEVKDFRYALAGSDLKMEAAIKWSRFDPGKISLRLSAGGDRRVVLNYTDVIIRNGKPASQNPVELSVSSAVWLDATIKEVSSQEAEAPLPLAVTLGGGVSYAAQLLETELSVSDTSDWKQPLGKSIAHLLHLEGVTTTGELVIQHS